MCGPCFRQYGFLQDDITLCVVPVSGGVALIMLTLHRVWSLFQAVWLSAL